MSQLKITVTEDDILNGKPTHPNGCAIALAIERELQRRENSGVQVWGSRIELDGKRYKMPKKGAAFVERFDKDKKLAKPFSFMLREVKVQPPKPRISRISMMPDFANMTAGSPFDFYSDTFAKLGADMFIQPSNLVKTS